MPLNILGPKVDPVRIERGRGLDLLQPFPESFDCPADLDRLAGISDLACPFAMISLLMTK